MGSQVDTSYNCPRLIYCRVLRTVNHKIMTKEGIAMIAVEVKSKFLSGKTSIGKINSVLKDYEKKGYVLVNAVVDNRGFIFKRANYVLFFKSAQQSV